MKAAKNNVCKKCNQVLMLDLECTCTSYLYRLLDEQKEPISKWSSFKLENNFTIIDHLERLVTRMTNNKDKGEDVIFFEVKKLDTDKRVGIFKCEVEIEVVRSVDINVEKIK